MITVGLGVFLKIVLIRRSSAEVSDWKTSPGEKLYSHLAQNDDTNGSSSHYGHLASLDKGGSTSGIFIKKKSFFGKHVKKCALQ